MVASQNKTKLTLLLVSSLTIMSVITISPALPQMAEAFRDVPNAEFLVKLVLTLPALFIAIVSPFTGRLIDRYGRLKLLWGALILYALSGSAGYYLIDLYAILLSRALLGIAVGVSMTIAITLIADYFEGAERQKFVGIQVAFMSLGGILFISLGGVLAEISWRIPFLIYLFALLVFPLTLYFLHEPKAHGIAADNQKSVKVPKFIWVLFINTMVMWIIFFLIPAQIPFHMNAIGIEQNSLIGMAIAVSTAFSAISSILYGKLKDRLDFVVIFAVGYFILALSFACAAWATNLTIILLAMMLAGLGMGMMIPNTNMWVMKLAPVVVRGREIGKLTTFWFLGQFLSPIVTFPLLRIWSLTTTLLVAAACLFLLSVGFLILYVSNTSD